MPEDKDLVFSTRPERREFLSLLSRDSEGVILFSKLEKSVAFIVTGWEPFSKEGEKTKIALVIKHASGKEFLFPLGATAQYVISDAGVESPDKLIDAVIHVDTYETGSTGQFAVGKRITKVVLSE